MTFIAALRHDRISAPWVIDGPINGGIKIRLIIQSFQRAFGKNGRFTI